MWVKRDGGIGEVGKSLNFLNMFSRYAVFDILWRAFVTFTIVIFNEGKTLNKSKYEGVSAKEAGFGQRQEK